ncbi:aldehyde dehydrogenase [Pradoshia eiseniae]|uniref:Aldehyde dehydrogenase n=1 Tax=Pradoshia eiseniae TaxID=2064768 RepID=A0A2S7N4U3_9BACI|nr:aldehyde dehydrogenase family protein [Pradoshia eiseniae]PQD97101.1 aldehyde dehydrogenase [Pradoshia eiseniae]
MSTETKVQEFAQFINGEWKPGCGGATFDVLNPADGEVVAKASKATAEDVNMAVQSAKETFESGVWSKKSQKERTQIMLSFAGKIKEHAQELIYLEGISTGATVRKIGGADIMQLILCLQQTANMSLKYEMTEHLPVMETFGPNRTQLVREPLGVVAAITPFNFPLVLAMWKIAPAIAMGNSIIVKPASDTPLGTLKLAELAIEAGLPKGVFNVITGLGSEVGEALVKHPDIRKVAFTGSTEIGKKIMEQSASTVKKVTLELGGKAAAIVLPDADFELTIPGVLLGVFFHAGQVCEASTRVLVHESIYEPVIEQLAAMTEKIKLGHPLDPSTGMGPVISEKQMNKVLDYIESGKDEGARLVCGGKRAEGPGLDNGYYIEPTIFADVTNDMRIAQEEIFGPVLCVMKYKEIDEAINIANDTNYGLSAGIWSRDVTTANEIATKLEAGTVWVNEWHVFRNDAPFGGYKESGLGRELGMQVFNEYTELKSIITSLTTENKQRQALGLIF